MNSIKTKIAMIGMYGGYYRGDYNPGCIMICLKTRYELKKRIENCEIDIFAIDVKTKSKEIVKEHKDGLDINFFPAGEGIALLESVLSQYDALVIGGDVIWSEDYEKDGKIFFLDSASFLATKKPVVLFNCVHRFESVKTKEHLFHNIEQRSKYIAVRTEFFKNELHKIGIDKVKAIPDPVLDLELKKVEKKANRKPLIGISVSLKLCDPLIAILKNTDLSQFDICFYAYSRQYDNHVTVMKMRSVFGDKFSYVVEYKDPVETFEMIAGFDISVSDTYHGTISAIIQNVPFVCINTEPLISSRITYLLKPFGLERQIVSAYPEAGENDAETGNRCFQEFNQLINNPPRVDSEDLRDVKKIIQQHFDDMADVIKESTGQLANVSVIG
ncbi:Polysaccharide pyruvyl transferase family protein WcaK [Chitinophaga sp. YR627]|uniref:polysaccharide pyruvyl transferase family protein n=1 Tax=Chitinophaga sp. YR627 TaxID=1881041 RepID=UPI0008E97CB4|nr:polysaccharide pyruvyl transferase family protein [Chitinophaga sp. YR627]SFN49379.1 Polysaccharide pyruvyl transferase family protein WcaK [Chitinophaga sp. YR627]